MTRSEFLDLLPAMCHGASIEPGKRTSLVAELCDLYDTPYLLLFYSVVITHKPLFFII